MFIPLLIFDSSSFLLFFPASSFTVADLITFSTFSNPEGTFNSIRSSEFCCFVCLFVCLFVFLDRFHLQLMVKLIAIQREWIEGGTYLIWWIALAGCHLAIRQLRNWPGRRGPRWRCSNKSPSFSLCVCVYMSLSLSLSLSCSSGIPE